MARINACRGKRGSQLSLGRYIRGQYLRRALPCLGLVLCLLLAPASKVSAAPPSRVLQLRDAGGQLAVGLGEISGAVRISAKDGVRVSTPRGGVLDEFSRAIRVVGEAGQGLRRSSLVWRVQIKAVRDEGAALALRQQVETDSGVSSYVIHDEPWYKVQVGNAASTEEAENLKARLQNLGYQDAWITRVEILEEKPSEQTAGTGAAFRLEDDSGAALLLIEEPQLMIEPINGHPVTLELPGSPPRSYRGHLRLTFLGQGKIQIVNIIDLEQYLYGVLGAELYSNNRDDLAALAAQAVAARTYSINSLGKHDREGFDLCATVHCQVYQGLERESDLIREAVDATTGLILVYEGRAISAVYHSNSGGATAGAEQVWSTRYSGYLRPKADEAVDPATDAMVELGKDRPGYSWEVQWPGDVLADLLRRYLQTELSMSVPDSAELRGLSVLKRDDLGRVQEIMITYGMSDGTELEYRVTKDKIRWVLRQPDGRILPSTRFELQVQEADGQIKEVSAVGNGNGHGLGLSQAGAVHMSRLGFGFEEILRHYYTDVELVELADYFQVMEAQLPWEEKGFVLNWTAVLGPDQGVQQVTDVLAWSPDGKSIAFGTEGEESGGLWIFDIYTGSLVQLLAEPVVDAVWKGDGSAIAAVSKVDEDGLRQLKVIEIGPSLAAGTDSLPTSVLAEGTDIHSPIWLADSDLVLFSQNGMIYGTLDGVSIPVITGARTPAVSSSGRQLAFSRDGALWFYQLSSGAAVKVDLLDRVESLCWSPDGRYLAASAGEDVVVVSVVTDEITARFSGRSPIWSPDGGFLAYVSQQPDGKGEVRIWELESKSSAVLASAETDGIRGGVQWAASGRQLAHSIDGRLHLMAW